MKFSFYNLSIWVAFLIGFGLSGSLTAQVFAGKPYFEETVFTLSIYGGGRSSQLTGTREMLGTTLSDPSSYDFTDLALLETVFGMGFYMGMDDANTFLALEVDYSVPVLSEDRLERSQGLYEDIDGLAYAVNFPQQRLALRPMIGIYLFSFLNIQGGFEWSINTTPDEITYNSNDPTFGRDLLIEGELRNHLKGRNSLNPIVRAELSLPMGVINNLGLFPFVNATRHWGQTDVIRTLPNDYRLQEVKNRLSSYSINAGVRINIY